MKTRDGWRRNGRSARRDGVARWRRAAGWLPALMAGMALLRPLPAAPTPLANELNRDPHLVAWWRFDESAGKTASDAASGKHDARIEGAAAEAGFVSGRIGRALKLDGKSSLVAEGFKGVTGTLPRTVAVWIKTSARNGRIIAWGANDAGKMFTLGFIRGRIGITPKGGYLYMKEATNDGAWHHVAAVIREGDPPNLYDHAALYLDGEPAIIHDIGLLDLWPIDTGSELDVQIGPGWHGLIDDLRLYDRALSADEIKALYQMAED